MQTAGDQRIRQRLEFNTHERDSAYTVRERQNKSMLEVSSPKCTVHQYPHVLFLIARLRVDRCNDRVAGKGARSFANILLEGINYPKIGPKISLDTWQYCLFDLTHQCTGEHHTYYIYLYVHILSPVWPTVRRMQREREHVSALVVGEENRFGTATSRLRGSHSERPAPSIRGLEVVHHRVPTRLDFPQPQPAHFFDTTNDFHSSHHSLVWRRREEERRKWRVCLPVVYPNVHHKLAWCK